MLYPLSYEGKQSLGHAAVGEWVASPGRRGAGYRKRS